jgi:hypothetical protein
MYCTYMYYNAVCTDVCTVVYAQMYGGHHMHITQHRSRSVYAIKVYTCAMHTNTCSTGMYLPEGSVLY